MGLEHKFIPSSIMNDEKQSGNLVLAGRLLERLSYSEVTFTYKANDEDGTDEVIITRMVPEENMISFLTITGEESVEITHYPLDPESAVKNESLSSTKLFSAFTTSVYDMVQYFRGK